MRLIDADALFVDLDGTLAVSPTGYIHGDTVADMIGDQPTVDAVPVVRCKDCKNNGTSDCGMSRWYYADNEPFHKESWNNPYDYCSRGEKNENEI